MIDNSDKSITSNITEIIIRRDMRAITNRLAEYEICFGNGFKVNQGGYNIKSTGFFVSGISRKVYFSDIPNADGITGELVLINIPANVEQVGPLINFEDTVQKTQSTIVRRNVGRIDYAKGEINISAINITSTDISQNTTIQISASPASNDVIGLQDLFLQFDVTTSKLTTISDTIISGADPTGTNYIITPNYSEDSIIRNISDFTIQF